MLNLAKCEILESHNGDLASTLTFVEEGSLLTWTMENGVAVLTPCTGESGEKFGGVSNTRFSTPNKAPYIEEVVVPSGSPYVVSTSRAPTAGSEVGVLVVADGADAAVSLVLHASVVSGTQYTRVGQDITVDASFAGRTIKLTYVVDLGVTEAALLYGHDMAPVPATITGTGVISAGVIYTTMYDATSDWTNIATTIRMGAGGIFTQSGAGTALDAIVAEAPSPGQPYLGIRIKP